MSEFVTLEQADFYFAEERVDADEWNAATDDAVRRKYLNCAENVIMAAFRIPESLTDPEDEESRAVKLFHMAIFEEALHLMQVKALRLDPLLMKGIESATVGPLSVKFNKDFGRPLIPDRIRQSLEGIGASEYGGNTIEIVPILP
jgi:hypothetical protein